MYRIRDTEKNQEEAEMKDVGNRAAYDCIMVQEEIRSKQRWKGVFVVI